MFRTLADPILSVVYPCLCLSCGKLVEHSRNGVACAECWASTRLFTGGETLCRKCGAYLGANGGNSNSKCKQCDDAHFDLALAAGIYERGLAATVIGLKKHPILASRAKDLLVGLADRLAVSADSLVIPVPLSRRRLFERGHNQAATIAYIIANAGNIPVNEAVLIRTNHTPMHRVGMDKKARESTVKNAFKIKIPRLVEGREIILTDDVLTSGSTASRCAQALKKQGAVKVTVVTLARAVM